MPVPCHLKRPGPEFIARFMVKVKLNKLSGCWLWQGCTCRDGYGKVKLNGRNRQAHRVSYAIFMGEVPEAMETHHRCLIRDCVNPNHLDSVTRGDNAADSNRTRHTVEYEIDLGWRVNCRICEVTTPWHVDISAARVAALGVGFSWDGEEWVCENCKGVPF